MPSTGSIASWRVPPGSVAFTHTGNVRIDSGVQQGDQVPQQTPFQLSSIWIMLPVLCMLDLCQLTAGASH